MFGSKIPKNRKFSIDFHYYDPDKERREKKGIRFERTYGRKQALKTRSLLWLLMLAALVGYLIYYFSRMAISG